LKADLFPSKTQHASNNTQYPEQSKGFLQQISAANSSFYTVFILFFMIIILLF
jgi:hypothetical protein